MLRKSNIGGSDGGGDNHDNDDDDVNNSITHNREREKISVYV